VDLLVVALMNYISISGSVVVGKKSSKDRDRLDVKKYYILVIRSTSINSKYKRVRVRLI
jgi:hypothetical protein